MTGLAAIKSRLTTGSFFTPYESPLKETKKYRFHPDYKNKISGGYKSLTYSHRLGHNDMLCRYESAGGTCNDPKCDWQHLRDIELDGAS